ncbi:protein MTL1-like [Pistacia vera]|uniref:protein MTL1-like n=1 Tax=Pistacia vera TaxID=55513 RepID=UPI00126319A7|nr:protein MTL1-like [Pistacia vera]
MDFTVNYHHNHHSTNSPSSSSTSSSNPHPTTTATATTTASDHDPMHSWWESVSKARSRILSLSNIFSSLSSSSSSSFSLSSLADSDRPALSLLSSPEAFSLISSALSAPFSGSGSDPLCQWLYDTYLSSDSHLRLIVLSFVPLLSAIYLSRLHSHETSSIPSLSGFEAVILAIYSSEAKSRGGKALLVQIPDLSQPSLYHTPRNKPTKSAKEKKSRPSVGVLSAPLEPQIAVKSTKRACILGTAFDCYYKQISQMPSWSQLEFCKFAAVWAGQDCDCQNRLDFEGENVNGHGHNIDDLVVDGLEKLGIEEKGGANGNVELKGVRIPLPWEFLQPVLRILGHCLLGPMNSQDVKDSASLAVRRLYARASHDLVPQAIIATRSLIQLDNRERAAAAAKASAAATTEANSSSNVNTPSKAKKPEILLVSK